MVPYGGSRVPYLRGVSCVSELKLTLACRQNDSCFVEQKFPLANDQPAEKASLAGHTSADPVHDASADIALSAQAITGGTVRHLVPGTRELILPDLCQISAVSDKEYDQSCSDSINCLAPSTGRSVTRFPTTVRSLADRSDLHIILATDSCVGLPGGRGEQSRNCDRGFKTHADDIVKDVNGSDKGDLVREE